MDTLFDSIHSFPPWIIALTLFAGTFILEDAAILSAAALSSGQHIHPALAFFAVMFGICSSDLGLYWMGQRAERKQLFKRVRNSRHMQTVEKWINRHAFLTVCGVRFMPGFRLPCYLMCGWLSVSARAFASAIFIASAVWTSTVFISLLWLEAQFADSWEHSRWALVLIMMGALYLLQTVLKKKVGSVHGENE